MTFHLDSAVYTAQGFNLLPNYGGPASVLSEQAMPTAATELHWPLVRDAGSWGTQTIEPIAQVIVAPNGSRYGQGTNGSNSSELRIPNEDSLDQELTDANLFSLNRFPGVDRLEGGIRVNAALHGGWKFLDGQAVDGLIGESYRVHKSSPWMVGSGLENQASDVVSRVSYTPGQYVDLTARARFDPYRRMTVTFADVLGTFGPQLVKFSGGYLHSSINPYFTYDYVNPFLWGGAGRPVPEPQYPYAAPRDEVTFGANTHYGAWKLAGSVQANLRTHELDTVAATGSYENECFIFSLIAYRRYTSLGGDNGASGVLFQITLKTVGEFGFHPM